jgi:hypothetical protein
MDSVHNMREALIGHKYYYLSSCHPVIPYGTYLGILVYKRFREPVYSDHKLFVGSYICKFTNYSGEFFPNELIKQK